jgi:hypothetical protein
MARNQTPPAAAALVEELAAIAARLEELYTLARLEELGDVLTVGGLWRAAGEVRKVAGRIAPSNEEAQHG